MSHKCSLITAPWWVRVPVGTLLFAPIFVFTVGSISIFLKEPTTAISVTSMYLFAGAMLCASLMLLIMNIKMMLGVSPAPNGFSPITLRVGGVFLFILPIAGFFTGHYEQVGYAAIPQAVFYLWCCFSLFKLAKSKAAKISEVPDEIA